MVWPEKKLQEKVSHWFIVVAGVFNSISEVHQNLINENVKISRWPPPVFFYWDFKIIILSDLIVQLYDWNKSCQKCHFKQHWFPWSTFQDASFPRQESSKFSKFEKFNDWQIWHRYLRFNHRVFWSRWKLSEIIF